MSLTLSPAFGTPARPIGILVAGGTAAATERIVSTFSAGHHARLWLCTGSGRAEVVALLDSIQFDLVVCDAAADPDAAAVVSAVRRGPYGGSLMLAADQLDVVTGERIDLAVHRRFGLEVPAPRPDRPHSIDTSGSNLRRPA